MDTGAIGDSSPQHKTYMEPECGSCCAMMEDVTVFREPRLAENSSSILRAFQHEYTDSRQLSTTSTFAPITEHPLARLQTTVENSSLSSQINFKRS